VVPDAGVTPLVIEDVATGVVDPTAIAIDGARVFFVHGAGELSRVAKAGGAVAPIATGQLGPGSLDATTEDLFWVNAGTHANDFLDGSVRWAAKAGGPDHELATSYLPGGLAVDVGSLTVFWVEIDGHRVRALRTDGTGAVTIDETPTAKTSIAVTPSRLVWTASGPGDDVITLDRPTSVQRALSAVEYAPGWVNIAGDDVFWIERHPLSDAGAIRVSRGGLPPIDLVADEDAPSALVRDGNTLYWTSAGRIRSIGRAGGTAVTLATARGPIGGLAVDSTHLYWTETARGAVVRAAR
jgi:hypothetical protein